MGRQARLITELNLGQVMESDPSEESSKALGDLLAAVPAVGSWVATYFNGDGVTFAFRLLVRDGAVVALLVEAEFETR
jgi:hypothetical protein